MLKHKNSSRLILAASLLLGAAYCKTPNQSQVSAGNPSVTTPRPGTPAGGQTSGKVGDFLSTTFPTDAVDFTLESENDGLIDIRISVSSPSAPRPGPGPAPSSSPVPMLTTPPHIVLTASTGGAAIVEGDLFVRTGSPGFYVGKLRIDGKKSVKYIVKVDQHGEVNNKGRGQVSSESIQLQPLPNPPDISNRGLDGTFVYDGKPIVLQLSPAQPGPSQLFINATLSSASSKVLDDNWGNTPTVPPGGMPTLKLQLIEPLPGGPKATDSVVTFQEEASVNAQLSYMLSGAISRMTLDFGPAAAGSVIQLSASIDDIRDRNGNKMKLPIRPINTPPVIAIAFNSNMARQGLAANGNIPMQVFSDVDQEGKVGIDLDATRFANQSPNAFKDKVQVFLKSPTNVQIADAFVTSGRGNIQSPSMIHYDGNLISDFVGNATVPNTVLMDPTFFEPNDLVTINLSASVADLTVPEGGKALIAKLNDHGVTMPAKSPDDYNLDKAGAPPPHPQKPPVDLAQKIVFEAMEKTRLAFHVRLPKGVTSRGPTNTIDSGTIAACLANAAPHWSDIILHYYCQHGQARACYTPKAPSGRAAAYAGCTADPSWDFIMGRMKDASGAVLPAQSDVFQYVMFSQTYAFDDQQQQDVINAFYHIDDPNSTDECNAKRPRRGIDPTDGTHCRAGKTFTTPMVARGN